MRNKNEVTEIEKEYTAVVKEYYITIPKTGLEVFGRVLKHTNRDNVRYSGDFSHFFLTGKGAFEYFRDGDDNIINSDIKQVEIQVIQYLEDFTVEFGKPKKNKFYK